jgi:hypothetical protein
MTGVSDGMSLAFAKTDGGLLVFAAAFITMLMPHGPTGTVLRLRQVAGAIGRYRHRRGREAGHGQYG